MTNCPYAFRILGATCEPRRLVNAGAAFAAYAACDERAQVGREAYLSAFQFGENFRRLLTETGSTAGFSGPCWSPWLWFDVDRADLDAALKDARRLVLTMEEHYRPGDDDLLLFFSGSKGFHVGLPTALWSPMPAADFHQTARRFAEHAAELAGVVIDSGVYDKVRALRAPNSKHPKTALHKRRLTFDELLGLSLDAILNMAKEPAPFDVPEPKRTSDQAAADWQRATDQAKQEAEAKAARRATANGSPTLNRATMDFIRDGAGAGDRHRLLFSAAANLAEFGCRPALAVALLEESALDSGLSPRDVHRGIECGLAARGSPSPPPLLPAPSPRESSEPPAPAAVATLETSTVEPPPAAELQTALARLWGSTPAPASDPTEAAPQAPAPDTEAGRAVLPPDPPRLTPLPPRAVGSGKLDKPCKCGSTEYADVAISEGRTRRDCRKCGKFVGWGRWYNEGGPTP